MEHDGVFSILYEVRMKADKTLKQT